MTLNRFAAKRHLLDVFQAGVDAVHGARCVAGFLEETPVTSDIYVISVGKAACAMLSGVLQVHGDRVVRGLVITKSGHLDEAIQADRRFQCIESGHPVPDANSLQAGALLQDFIGDVPPTATCLFLVSGGTSSLVEVLPEGVSLEDLSRLNEWLLGSGLGIEAVNQVRQSVSLIKGGGLLNYLEGQQAMVLLISDVPADDPAIIGSGLLHRQQESVPLPDSLPDWIEVLVEKAASSHQPGTGREVEVKHHVVATLDIALEAAAEHGRVLGFSVKVMQERLAGPAEKAGQDIAARLKNVPPGLYLWGGETTVDLPGTPGRGGRCQHLALAAAGSLAGCENIFLLAAGTDGSDCSSEVAGAIVDSVTVSGCDDTVLDSNTALRCADSGTFLAAAGNLVKTGPTGTNVTDIVIGMKLDDVSDRQ